MRASGRFLSLHWGSPRQATRYKIQIMRIPCRYFSYYLLFVFISYCILQGRREVNLSLGSGARQTRCAWASPVPHSIYLRLYEWSHDESWSKYTT